MIEIILFIVVSIALLYSAYGSFKRQKQASASISALLERVRQDYAEWEEKERNYIAKIEALTKEKSGESPQSS